MKFDRSDFFFEFLL